MVHCSPLSMAPLPHQVKNLVYGPRKFNFLRIQIFHFFLHYCTQQKNFLSKVNLQSYVAVKIFNKFLEKGIKIVE